MRYTNAHGGEVLREDIPLIDYHIARLKEAHAHFAENDSAWGEWPGDDGVWQSIRSRLEEAHAGDWRVRVVLHAGATIEVQVVPAPAGAGEQHPQTSTVLTFRAVLLSTRVFSVSATETGVY
jgi:hypothetical protein